jgi:GntR family transcriptional regulator
MITFRLETHSGQPPYRQLIQQVKHALRLGMLKVGDQLPTAKDVVGYLAINPNTVLKAYRELEWEGLIQSRQGQGTFVLRAPAGGPIQAHIRLRGSLSRWLREARAAGLDEEAIEALFLEALNEPSSVGVAS